MHALILQVALELTGVVMGPNGKPLPKATLTAGTATAQTDAKGRFHLKVPEGITSVRITAPDLEPQVREITPGQPLLVLMEPAVKGVTVEVVDGSGYGTEGTPTSAINRMEIYLTPGAAADVFQAAKALPGVSNATEGAELYVRGGKPEEVGIWLNGGRLAHPYHHPNTQGGIFSIVDTAIVTTVNFIPGGFSARYGDALSAVLDLVTDGATAKRGGIAVLNAASQGVQVDEPLGENGLGRVSARYSNTLLLDKWFGLSRNFQEAPISVDAHVAYQTSVGKAGRLSLLGLGANDHLGVDLRIANLDNTYLSRNRSNFLSASYQQVLSEQITLNLALSHTRYGQRWTFGPWGMDQSERSTFHRVEVGWAPSEAVALEAGVDGDRVDLSPRGKVPFDMANWGPGAEARSFAYDFDARRQGAYATLRWRLAPAWGLSLGGRTDQYALLSERTGDVRATLSYQAAPKVVLRFAAGTFHQAPPMTAVDPYAGNRDLKTLRATHALVALDARDEQAALPWQVRLEAFTKQYDRLLVRDPRLRWVGTGHGQAQGLDLLVKLRKGTWRGWLGYGYLSTTRLEDKQTVEGPVPTSIPHNVTAVLSWGFRTGWEASMSYRYASGAPFTAILGGKPDGTGGWTPLEGARYGDRLPNYSRCDLRITHLFTRGKFRFAAFGELMNLLDQRNVSGYTYSPDYGQRHAEPSYFGKFIGVAGLTIM